MAETILATIKCERLVINLALLSLRLDPYPFMQVVDSTMSEIAVACENCHNLQNQLDVTTDYIARLTESELCQIAIYREQIDQQERNYEIDLQQIAADRQKTHEVQAVRLDKKLEIAERSLRDTKKILQDTKEALAYEQARNTKMLSSKRLRN